MPAAVRNQNPEYYIASEALPGSEVADQRHEPSFSPARVLQQRLVAAYERPHRFDEPEVAKLHPIARLAILIGITSTSWGVLILAAGLISLAER